MAQPKTAKTLDGALRAAQDNLQVVPRDANNSFHGYSYTSAEAMMGAVRSVLLAEGLVLSETGTEIIILGDRVAGVRVGFSLRHVESGESREWSRDFPVVPEKGRPMDKAFASALTTGLNYALRGLLLVPRVDAGEDMDHDSRDRGSARTARGPSTSDLAPRPAPGNGAAGVVPPCPSCGGRVYDNRQDPDRGNRPLWSCSIRMGEGRCRGGKDGQFPWGSYDEEPPDLFATGGSPPVYDDPPPPHFDDMHHEHRSEEF